MNARVSERACGERSLDCLRAGEAIGALDEGEKTRNDERADGSYLTPFDCIRRLHTRRSLTNQSGDGNFCCCCACGFPTISTARRRRRRCRHDLDCRGRLSLTLISRRRPDARWLTSGRNDSRANESSL